MALPDYTLAPGTSQKLTAGSVNSGQALPTFSPRQSASGFIWLTIISSLASANVDLQVSADGGTTFVPFANPVPAPAGQATVLQITAGLLYQLVPDGDDAGDVWVGV